MKFYITSHCKNRYRERMLGNSNSVSNIVITILRELNESVNITSKISTEYPRYILYLKERYGNDGYNIMKNGKNIFICKKRKGTLDLYDVVTCYILNNSLDMFKNTALSNADIYIKLKLIKQ